MGSNLPLGIGTNDLYNETEQRPPKKGECAVCGKPVRAHVPPHKDHKLRFCDNHSYEDIRHEIENDPLGDRYRRH